MVNHSIDEWALIPPLKEQERVEALRARDYLDFIEISQARDLSGEFEDYMRLKEELELRPRPKRHDRITEVLGTMEKVYEARRGR